MEKILEFKKSIGTNSSCYAAEKGLIMTTRADIVARLPALLAARRSEAAALVGISASYFDRLVASGVLPPGRALGDVVVWSVDELRACINSLPSREFDDGQAIEL